MAAAVGATARRADLADPASWPTTVVTNRAIQRAVGRGRLRVREAQSGLPPTAVRPVRRPA
ncbi:MAG: hypothetical protein R2734_00465 [Nocardioides sp.]